MNTFAEAPFSDQREEMIGLLRKRGIADANVLNAFRRVPREIFVPDELRTNAYEDGPLPIGHQQTISQPYVVAIMAEAARLSRRDRVLEIGTGSGFAAAILASIATEVFTVERVAGLATSAAELLRQQGFGNVFVLHSDGTLGWPEHAPYDAILVAAGGPRAPQALIEQLGPGGRLVIPIGESQLHQRLIRFTRTQDGIRTEDLGKVRFVPLIGSEGWPIPNTENENTGTESS